MAGEAMLCRKRSGGYYSHLAVQCLESLLSSDLRVAPLLCFQMDWETHRLRTDLQNQDQPKEQLKALSWHWLDQPEDLPEEVAKIFNFSEAVTQLSILVSGLERMAKELDASTLKVYFLRYPPNSERDSLNSKRPSCRSLLGGVRGGTPGMCGGFGVCMHVYMWFVCVCARAHA